MATFSPAEVEFLQAHGNARAKALYLASWTPDVYSQPAPGDLEGLRRFIRLVFVDARWKANTPAAPPPMQSRRAESIPTPEPLSSILGPDIPKLSVTASAGPSAAKGSDTLIDLLGDFSPAAPTTPVPQPVPAPAQTSTSASFDLLASFTNAGPSPAPPILSLSSPATAAAPTRTSATLFDPFQQQSSLTHGPDPNYGSYLPQSPYAQGGFSAPPVAQPAAMLHHLNIPPMYHASIIQQLSTMPPTMHAAYLHQLAAQLRVGGPQSPQHTPQSMMYSPSQPNSFPF